MAASTFVAAAAGAQAAGQIVGGLSARSQARTQAAIADIQATQAEQAGRINAEQIQRQGERMEGAAITGYAKGGVALEGSAMDALDAARRDVELDRQRALAASAQQAASLRAGGQLQRQAGDQAMFGGFMGTGGTALGGYSRWSSLAPSSTATYGRGVFEPTTGRLVGGI